MAIRILFLLGKLIELLREVLTETLLAVPSVASQSGENDYLCISTILVGACPALRLST